MTVEHKGLIAVSSDDDSVSIYNEEGVELFHNDNFRLGRTRANLVKLIDFYISLTGRDESWLKGVLKQEI